MPDLAIVVATLTFLSAGLQRFIEVFDWLWTLMAGLWAKRGGRTATDEDLKCAKGNVVLIVSTIIGTIIACTLLKDLTTAALVKAGVIKAEETAPMIWCVFVGFMISGGTEGTNSVIKFLEAAKEKKKEEVKPPGV